MSPSLASSETPGPEANGLGTKNHRQLNGEDVVMAPYVYFSSRPSKKIREACMAAFNIWLQVPEEAVDKIEKVIFTLHTASMMLDDIEDGSSVRNGRPAAHKKFGVAHTINSANYGLVLSLRRLEGLSGPQATQIYTEELSNMLQGQALEIFWRDNMICPTEEEYFAMIDNKTGGLFRMALRLMQAESVSPHSAIDVSTFASTLGQILQIHNDYINLRSTKYQKDKGFCEDLDEGKYSFLIQHSINANASDTTITSLLAKVRAGNVLTPEEKLTALTYLEETTNTFAHTQQIIERMCDSLQERLNDISKATGIRNPFFEDILKKFRHVE